MPTRLLIWKINTLDIACLIARKLNAAKGQYVIYRKGDAYGIWNRHRAYNGEIASSYLGHATTIDGAKRIAQADADRLAKRRDGGEQPCG